MSWISPSMRRRLEVQGFVDVDKELLAETVSWLRFSFGLCTVLAALGTFFASPATLLVLAVLAVLGAVLPFHPFDQIYNLWIRRFTRTRPLPRRGAPGRFTWGLTALWLAGAAIFFMAGKDRGGYILGGLLVLAGTLAAVSHICLLSTIYRIFFGWPEYTGT